MESFGKETRTLLIHFKIRRLDLQEYTVKRKHQWGGYTGEPGPALLPRRRRIFENCVSSCSKDNCNFFSHILVKAPLVTFVWFCFFNTAVVSLLHTRSTFRTYVLSSKELENERKTVRGGLEKISDSKTKLQSQRQCIVCVVDAFVKKCMSNEVGVTRKSCREPIEPLKNGSPFLL